MDTHTHLHLRPPGYNFSTWIQKDDMGGGWSRWISGEEIAESLPGSRISVSFSCFNTLLCNHSLGNWRSALLGHCSQRLSTSHCHPLYLADSPGLCPSHQPRDGSLLPGAWLPTYLILPLVPLKASSWLLGCLGLHSFLWKPTASLVCGTMAG
uniref:C-X-C motif chemokine ligand 12 n=1 Tax=Sus scrofa TaxID=9823 RepID=A0A4X1VAR3_PIG